MTALRNRTRQGLLGGVAITLLAEGIALPAAVITAVVLTRAFGPETYGRFAVVATTVAVTEWLLIAVFARPVVKFVAEADDWRPVAATSFRVYLLSGFAIGLLCWILAGSIAGVLDDPQLAPYFRAFAVQIPLFALGAGCRNVLAGRGRYREQAVSSGLGWIGRVAFIVAFVRLGHGVEGAIAGSICGTAVGSVAALVLVGRGLWHAGRFPVRRLMQLALPAFLSLLCARLLDQVGLLSVEALAGSEAEVGYYGAAMNATLVTSVIGAALAPVLLSAVTEARSTGDHARTRQVAGGVVRFGLVLFPFAAIVVGTSTELVRVLFGEDFGPAAPLMAALSVAAVARANSTVLAGLLVALDRAWIAAWLAIPLPVAALAAHLALVPRFGAIAAALVTMLLALVATVASIVAICPVAGIRVPFLTLARAVLIGAAAYTLAVLWPAPGVLALVKVAALGAGVVAGFLITGELGNDELRDLGRSLIRGGPPQMPS